MRKNRPEVVVSCVDEISLVLGWLVSRLSGCKFFVAATDPPFTNRYQDRAATLKQLEMRLRTYFLREVLSSSTLIFGFIEPSALTEFLRHESKLLCVKIGASDEAFEYNSLCISRSARRDSGCFTVGFIGAINVDQGIEDLLEAVARIRCDVGDIRVLLIGDLSSEFNLEEHTAKRNLDGAVLCTGWVNYGTMLERLAQCDVGCYLRRESRWSRAAYPLKICEYLGLRKPVVSWDYPGCRTILDGGAYGELLPVGDIEALAAALKRLADSNYRAVYETALMDAGHSLYARTSYGKVVQKIDDEIVRVKLPNRN